MTPAVTGDRAPAAYGLPPALWSLYRCVWFVVKTGGSAEGFGAYGILCDFVEGVGLSCSDWVEFREELHAMPCCD